MPCTFLLILNTGLLHLAKTVPSWLCGPQNANAKLIAANNNSNISVVEN